MDVLTNFLSTLAVGLLVIAIPIVVAAVFLWARQKSAEIKQNLTKEQLSIVEAGIKLAVRAAEQVGLSGQLKTGGEKRDYAVNSVQKYLDRAGIPIEVDEIATLIEAEVNSQFSNYAPPVDTPETRSALIDKAIETAVLAAEQTGAKKLAVETAAGVAMSKKDYAVDLASKYLAEHGLKVDTSLIDGLIEAQIMRLKLQALQWKAGK
ncbi:MAG: phage holin family protein [Chloroflexi bacterium]|nr:phage holin family protein [Chloroflexota bacterium]